MWWKGCETIHPYSDPPPQQLSPMLLPNSSPRTPLLGSQWWWMSGGARAGHLSTPLPLPPLIRVICPLWVSALSESLLPRDRQPRLPMTTGLAGGTHPSPERISFYLPLDKLYQLFIFYSPKRVQCMMLLKSLWKTSNYRARSVTSPRPFFHQDGRQSAV